LDTAVMHGTDAADRLSIGPNSPLAVKWRGPDRSTETVEIGRGDVELLEVRGEGGDDVIDASQLSNDDVRGTQLLLRGGDGNDRINGSDGADIILGEAGDDVLQGMAGRDLLIGGLGADQIMGNEGDDIVLAGFTDFDTNNDALMSILAEWNSNRDYSTRVANLMDGSGSPKRLNGQFFLNDRTVHDDGAVDVLFGNGGRDWFLYNIDGDGGAKDIVKGWKAGEIFIDIDDPL
jgi:Ca2+-binding RTX toxin-like protein